MDRIQHPSATSDNLFTEGDPALGIPATTVTATVLNGWQEELIHLIEEAGLTPSVADNTQVLQALSELFQPRGVTTDVRLFEALTADFVTQAKTLDIEGQGDAVVIVKGSASGPLTLTLQGVIPAGCRVTVVNWSPAALTVETTVTGVGNGEPLGYLDWAQVVMGAGQSSWYNISLRDSENVRTSIASEVYAEGQRAQTEEADIRNDLGTMISQETARAQAVEGQIRTEVDRISASGRYTTNMASYPQKVSHTVLSIALDSGNTYEIVGDSSYTLDPSQATGPTTFSVTLRSGGTLLKRFSTGVVTPMQASSLDNEEKLGTLPVVARISGVEALTVQIWAAVGAGGLTPYMASVDLLIRRVNRT